MSTRAYPLWVWLTSIGGLIFWAVVVACCAGCYTMPCYDTVEVVNHNISNQTSCDPGRELHVEQRPNGDVLAICTCKVKKD